MRLLPRILGCLAVAALALPGAVRADQAGPQRETLQEFFERLRKNRDGALNELRATVDPLLSALESAVQTGNTKAVDDAKRKLTAVGPEAALLLVEKLDPGQLGSEAARKRAAHVTQLLADMRAPAITGRLIEITRVGTLEGRINAIHVLCSAPDRDRAAQAVQELYKVGYPELRPTLLYALAKIGGPELEQQLVAELGSSKPEAVRDALDAIARAHNPSFEPHVLALLERSDMAYQQVDNLAAYYRSNPDARDKKQLQALLGLVKSESAPVESRLGVLNLLPLFAGEFDSDMRRELKLLANQAPAELREGILITVFLCGDRGVRKDILKPYDDQIDRNKEWADSYEQRGAVLLRIGEPRQAIDDYKRALDLSTSDVRARMDSAYIGLARAYMLAGRTKDAVEVLKKAPLTKKQLGEIEKDSDFAKVFDDPKLRKQVLGEPK
jgi:tetratricopeptide (TPR) repeat protein